MSAPLPLVLPGHWSTPEGQQMATRSLTEARADQTMGHLPDLALANAVFMASRDDLNLIVYQTAAKERIRWLSAQLAAARQALDEITMADDTAEAHHLAQQALERCR